MKNVLSVIAVSATILSTSTAFAASTGTINFEGLLTDTTCDVDINGQGSDALVTLPTVSVKELTAPGATAGRTSFNMNIKDCTTTGTNGISKVSAFFQPGSTVDLSTGHLMNMSTTGNATNVQLQLLDPSNSFAPINVGNTDQVKNTAYVDIKADQTALVPYAVQYYATAQTTPGVVTSSVVYNLQYK